MPFLGALPCNKFCLWLSAVFVITIHWIVINNGGNNGIKKQTTL